MNLYLLIKKRGMSIETVAKEAGIASSTIRRANAFETSPSVETVVRIASVINEDPVVVFKSLVPAKSEDNHEDM